MTLYKKRVEISDTGMVTASVFRADGSRCGLKFFSGLFSSTAAVEKRAIKAHAWANNYIAMCERQESLPCSPHSPQ